MNLTAKQEIFAQALARGMTQSDAYREAYGCKGWKDNSIHIKASQLAANDKVKLRIEELKERAVKRHDLTVDDILKELEEARKKADDLGQSSAMVSASMGKAKLLGLEKNSLSVSGELNLKTVLVEFVKNEKGSFDSKNTGNIQAADEREKAD